MPLPSLPFGPLMFCKPSKPSFAKVPNKPPCSPLPLSHVCKPLIPKALLLYIDLIKGSMFFLSNLTESGPSVISTSSKLANVLDAAMVPL